MNKKVKLIESRQDLYETIYPMVKEALMKEGFWDVFKGSVGQVGKDVSQGAQNIYSGAKNASRNFAQNIQNKANNAVQGVKNYANKVKTAGQMAGLNADNQKIADQLEEWLQSGVFGGSNTASSCVSQLVNALNLNFSNRFGQQGSAQRYRNYPRR